MPCTITHVKIVLLSGVSDHFTSHVVLQVCLRNGLRRLASLSLCLENKMFITSKSQRQRDIFWILIATEGARSST